MAMQAAGRSAMYGCVSMAPNPSWTMSPQLGVGGRMPIPMKESVASVMIAPGIVKARLTITGARTWGTMCLTMIA